MVVAKATSPYIIRETLHTKFYDPVPMSSEDIKPFACTACVQRKVKCDKHEPCLACVRSRLQCKYRTTPPPQRRKRKAENATQTLLEKLRTHEAAMRSAGLSFEAFDDPHDGTDDQAEARGETTESPRGRSFPAAQVQPLTPGPNEMQPVGPMESSSIAMQKPFRRRGGILVSEHGGKRYYEHGLIGILGQEYRQGPVNLVNQQSLAGTPQSGVQRLQQQQTSDMLAASILPGQPSLQASPQYQHPPAAAIAKYWSAFVDNVHPLTKIIHAPTVHQVMVDIASMTENECQKSFGESQVSLLYAFQTATRYALLESSFLAIPDIELLCAHVLFLTSLLHTSDPSTLWILIGSAIRMAQSQGLHRDGAAFELSPFEIEMRRRLWWYLVTLDRRLTELMGFESSLPKSMDTLLPSNVDDSDINPDMAVPPKERTGASEMTFCLLQYEITRFLQERDPRPDVSEPPKSSTIGKQGEKRSVSDLESFLEEKFLRFCDPVIPLQFLTTTIARSNLCKMRQMAHHRRFRPNPDIPRVVNSERKGRTVSIAARNIEYDNLIHSSRSLRGFLWHVHFYFPWGAPVFLLKNLASRSEWDDEMEAAWVQIEELYEHHPEYIETDRVIHLIVGNLTLKAWAAREAALESRGIPKQRMPAIIAALQSREVAFLSQHSDSTTDTTRLANEEINFTDMSGFDSFAAANFGLVDQPFVGVEWANWVDY